MLNWLVTIVVLIWIGIPIYERLTRIKRVCPSCQSESIELISKEPASKPIIHGGRVSATVKYHARYHCKRCGERWEKTESESW